MSLGDSIERADGRAKVTGAARYAAEIRAQNLAHGVIVGSTIAHGTLAAIDTSAALELPGVLAVLTPWNAPRLPKGGGAGFSPPSGRRVSALQDPEVHYNGQPIALVVAETLERAIEAAGLVRPAYRERAAAVDFRTALAGATPYPDKILGIFEPASRRGDVDAGLAAADVRIEAEYTTPIETHNPMEPHATVAEWRDGELTLHDSTQYVFGVRSFIAATFGIAASRVRVVCDFTGGAFGSKGSAWSHVVLAALAARESGRPVRVVLNRRQMFGPVGARPYTAQRLTVGATRDGTLTAIRHASVSSTSVFEDWLESSALVTRMLYVVPNLETRHDIVRLNVGTPTFNRAPGEATGTFALESALDELAIALDMDPVELRLRNYAAADPDDGRAWSSNSLRECYAAAAERFGWSQRDSRPGAMRDGTERIGWGMASATYPTIRQPASACVRALPGGEIIVQAATHELGTGTYTVMAQIAAAALGVGPDRVRVELGDTRLPENPISAGSMTVASTGSAVHEAALALRERLLARGGDSLEAALERLDAAVEARADARPGAEQRRYAMHAFGAVFAEVRVDEDLGTVRATRIVGAYGVGRVLNLRTARSQLLGGIVYALGHALHEHTAIDTRTGRYLNADLAEYLLPVNADVREIDVLFVDEHDPHVNPLGAKGIGEIGATGVAAAIANAVHHASGVRVRDLPITLDRLL